MHFYTIKSILKLYIRSHRAETFIDFYTIKSILKDFLSEKQLSFNKISILLSLF